MAVSAFAPAVAMEIEQLPAMTVPMHEFPRLSLTLTFPVIVPRPGVAGVMLILAGAIDFFDGIRAIGANTTSFDTIFWDNNLEAWGWFYLIVGIVLIATGYFVFQRASWAVTVGIIAATVSAVATILVDARNLNTANVRSSYRVQ